MLGTNGSPGACSIKMKQKVDLDVGQPSTIPIEAIHEIEAAKVMWRVTTSVPTSISTLSASEADGHLVAVLPLRRHVRRYIASNRFEGARSEAFVLRI